MPDVLHSEQPAELPVSLDSENQPKYERLRDYVVSQIEAGILKEGAAIPSENRLSETLQIARSTVRQALAVLEREGLVRRVHGKGTFIHEQARSRLRKGQDLFALIVPETEAAFYPSLQRSFEGAAAELASQVIVCNSNNDVDRQGNTILQLMDLHVAGVAIIPPTMPATPAYHVRQLQQHGMPVVCCSRPVLGVQVPLLAIPFEEIGQRAGEEIRKAGHRRVAFLGSMQGEAVQAYERGFRKAMGSDTIVLAYSCQTRPALQQEQEVEITQILDQWLQHPTPPTAIFCSFDTLAELVFVLLTQRGVRVPAEISLIGVGGTFRGAGLSHRLTSVTLDEVGMGQAAIQLLNQMRQGVLPIDHPEKQAICIGFSPGGTLQKTGASATPRIKKT